jgi:hypothetical protein
MKIALVGLPRVGKDWIAQHLLDLWFARGFGAARNIKIRSGIDDILEKLGMTVPPERLKTLPGGREVQQAVGYWAKGYFTKNSPLTIERVLFANAVHKLGDIYKDFGHNPAFLVDLLNRRENASDSRSNLVISDHRFLDEVKPLKAIGFKTVLVMCPESMRQERASRAGDSYLSGIVPLTDEYFPNWYEKKREAPLEMREALADHLVRELTDKWKLPEPEVYAASLNIRAFLGLKITADMMIWNDPSPVPTCLTESNETVVHHVHDIHKWV